MKKPGHTGTRLVACLLSGYVFIGPIYGQINRILVRLFQNSFKNRSSSQYGQ